jgi:hypothetical protein
LNAWGLGMEGFKVYLTKMQEYIVIRGSNVKRVGVTFLGGRGTVSGVKRKS